MQKEELLRLLQDPGSESTDLDFCIHYKDFNPYLYRV